MAYKEEQEEKQTLLTGLIQLAPLRGGNKDLLAIGTGKIKMQVCY